MLEYLVNGGLLPDSQSAYRAYHSTETAVLKVQSDILRAVVGGDLVVLALLDLSAAFETVHHDILLHRLDVSYGLGGMVHGWIRSYLTSRIQFVHFRASNSDPMMVSCGIPQGSVLGPILFLLYTADVVRIVKTHSLHPHLYADDTQIYGFCSPGSTVELHSCVSA